MEGGPIRWSCRTEHRRRLRQITQDEAISQRWKSEGQSEMEGLGVDLRGKTDRLSSRRGGWWWCSHVTVGNWGGV